MRTIHYGRQDVNQDDIDAVVSVLRSDFLTQGPAVPDFEKAIVERTEADPDQFTKSGSYLYLRSGLIERWDILNKYHTYPNMIKPLKIK